MVSSGRLAASRRSEFSLTNQSLGNGGGSRRRCPLQPAHAPELDQALRLQVLRRTHHLPAAGPAGRRGRPQRLRQVQHHGRGALGAGREQGQRAARRVDAGRDLQRLGPAQAGQPRQRRTGVRQRRCARRRAVEPVRRDRRQARADARRHLAATTSTTSRCAAATCRTCSSAPASGPRAYAIIGQGTISRIIESKPEELRMFLEEAAGVSKYKERRRETENRLKDTRENLMRVEDILRELNANLDKLERAGRGGAAVPRAAGRGRAEAAPAVVPQAPRCGQRGGARQEGRCWRRPTRSKRASPNCARSKPSWRPSARRTTRPATACTARRGCWPRRRSKSAGSRSASATWSKAVSARSSASPSCRRRMRQWQQRSSEANDELAAIAEQIAAADEQGELLAAQAEEQAQQLPALEDALRSRAGTQQRAAQRGGRGAAADPAAGGREPQRRRAARQRCSSRRERLAAERQGLSRARRRAAGRAEAVERPGRCRRMAGRGAARTR